MLYLTKTKVKTAADQENQYFNNSVSYKCESMLAFWIFLLYFFLASIKVHSYFCLAVFYF